MHSAVKKPRVQSPLDRLPLRLKQQIAAWLTTGGADGIGFTYQQVKDKLLAEHGVSVGTTALHNFFKRQGRLPTATADVSESPVARTITVVITIPK